jgi:hypothetical protein
LQEYFDELRVVNAHRDESVLDSIRRQFQRNLSAYKARTARQRSTHGLKVGDFVLELRENVSSLDQPAVGPYRLVALENGGSTAVLETGMTAFRETQRFKRHVSNLARYYTAAQILRPAPLYNPVGDVIHPQ